MSMRDRQRAEACFALARSTTFDGERDSAIARGTAIAEKAGLDLDGFDIPGRTRAGNAAGRCFMCGLQARESRFGAPCYSCSPSPSYAPFHEYGNPDAAAARPFHSRGDKAPERYSSEDLAAIMRKFRDAMRAQNAARRAEEAEATAAYDSAAERVSAALRRQQQAIRWPDLAACVSFLFSRGVTVYDMGADPDDDLPRWYAPGRDPERVDDWGLRSLADEVAA